MNRSGIAISLAIGALTLARGPAAAQVPSSSYFDDLEYRHIGPIGNRVSAVTGVPGDPNVYYVGAASGGIFKSTDGGHSWDPVFDDQPVASIGALAVDPTDPQVIWAGTGEPFIRSNVSHGNGIYRSEDGGRSWRHLGLTETGRIARIVIHPENPEIVFVAALGHLYGAQEERGVYRTTDGGRTWERILFVDEYTGASDLVMAPGDPDLLFAGTWPMLIRTWGRWSGGVGGGIWRSADGGDTWERLEGNGLPSGPIGKIGLAVTRADPDRIYALIETNSNRAYEGVEEAVRRGLADGIRRAEPVVRSFDHDGVLWRSDDRGATWTMVNGDHTLAQRPLYYTRAVAAPDDADEVHFLSTSHTRSFDGGVTTRGGGAGGDNHDMWIDPLIPERMIVGHDGGVSISTNRGEDWFRPPLPIAQMYHVYTDNRIPYYVYGNRQDGSSYRGPSNTRSGGSIPLGSWHSVGGCESGFAVPDTVTNNVVWSGCYEGILDRFTIDNRHSRTVTVWPDNPEGWPAGELRYRFQWTFPIHISPHDNEVVYVGSQHVHRTRNGGQSWEVISPDLTTDNPVMQEKTGGLTPDDSSPTYGSVVFAIAESPVQRGLIWAGSNDGLVHLTRDDGATWTDVTANIPDLPPNGTVSNIEPSRFAAGTAYLAMDLHQLGDFAPYLYRTTDFGESWTKITNGLPSGMVTWTHVIREDPAKAGLLYAGTESGVHVSFDDGASWTSLQSDLPRAPAHWLTIQPHFGDLVVGTYGRGFWILDDITPLRAIADGAIASDVHLFEPRPAYRFLSRAGDGGGGTPADGRNPPYGAILHYHLAEAGAGATIEMLDGDGEVVRTLRGPGSAGLHRVVWNLRYEGSSSPRMRTPVVEHSHVELRGNGTRPAGEGGGVSPLAPPGRYTVRLTVDGEVRSAPLVILQDPDSEGSLADIFAQHEMLLELRADATEVVELIDAIEAMRAQIDDREERLGGGGGREELRDALERTDTALISLEMLLTDLRLSGGSAGQDRLRWPRQLYAKIVSLAGYVSGTDHPPTDQAREVHRIYRETLAEYQARLEEIRRSELVPLNRRLEAAGLEVIAGGNPGGSGR